MRDDIIKKKKKKKKDKEKEVEILKSNKNTIDFLNLGDFVMEKGILYGINRNVGRDIPWIYDGLVSVERRILHTMYENGHTPNKGREKVATIIGKLMGDYYPHSDQSPAKTLSRLGRASSIMIPYIDGGGNYGNPYTKQAAHARYISARLSKYAYDCFFSENDSHKPVYDTKDNYTYNKKEPVYLATKYPNVLMQWNSGIGSGVSATLCAFNSIDIFKTAIKLIDDPNAHVDIYPDTPMAVDIVNKKELKGCFDMHKFPIRMEGQYHLETLQDLDGTKIVDKHYIVFTSYPINSSPVSIEKELVKLEADGTSKVFKEIKDVNVKPPDDKLEFYIEYEKGYDPRALAEKIMKKTRFADTIGAQFVLIKDNQPLRYTPRMVLLEWLAIRIDQKRRYIHQKIVKILSEKVVLEGVMIIVKQGALEEVVKLVQKSKDDETLIETLRTKYKLTELQAKYIADTRIKMFNRINVSNAEATLDKIDKEYNYLKSVADEKSIRELIKDDLRIGLEKYGVPRRAKLTNKKATELENVAKTLVYNGDIYYCLRNYEEFEQISSKIDKGFDVVEIESEDRIMIFDVKGNIKVIDGFSFTFNTDGIGMGEIIGKNDSYDKCVKIIPLTSKLKQVTVVSKLGYAKNMLVGDLTKSQIGRVVNLAKGDELVSVIPSEPEGVLGMVCGDKLYYVNMESVPLLKRTSAGNKMIKSEISGISRAVFIDNTSKYLLVYGEGGYMKIIATAYLNYAKRKDNIIEMVGKGIFDVIPVETGRKLGAYYGGGHTVYNITGDDTTFILTDDEGKVNKLRLSTSVGALTKVVKVSKNEFYKMWEG